MVKYEIVT